MDDQRVLLWGISGSGKTTVFRAIFSLWQELYRYLKGLAPAYDGKGGLAMHLTGLPHGDGLLACGGEAFIEGLRAKHPKASLLHIRPDGFKGDWPKGHTETYANIVLADREDHQLQPVDDWMLTDDDIRLNWMAYLAQPQGRAALNAINALLVGKSLKVDSREGLQVFLNPGGTHSPRYLSLGEKCICQLCCLAGERLRMGGVLMLDEPDMHLHPSQMLGVIVTLENLTLQKGGQLVLISHQTQLWCRYEEIGLAIALEKQGGGHR